MSNIETDEQVQLRGFLKLLSELQSRGKITGQQFREHRELWIKQQPNDRDVTLWNLRTLLNEIKPSSQNNQSSGIHKKPTRQKL